MSRPKSEKTILLEKERAIRRERREQQRVEKEARRVTREVKRTARESYDAKNGGVHEMKISVFHPRLCCQGCGGFGIATRWLPGVGPVCPECLDKADGRATPAEQGTTAVVQSDQLALFES
jgi:hypothetical protein